MLLALAIVGLFVLPAPWGVIAVFSAAVVEVAEVFFWIRFLRRYPVERETKLPAAVRLVSSIGCQHVRVTAMPSDMLVDAAGHHCRAVPIGACGRALIWARIDLGWNPRHC